MESESPPTGQLQPSPAGPPPLPEVPMAGYAWAATEAQPPSAAERWMLPVGRSGLAIAAGYAGLFAFIVFPAPVALVLGALALRDLRRHPELAGRGRAWFALVTGAVFSIILVAGVAIGIAAHR